MSFVWIPPQTVTGTQQASSAPNPPIIISINQPGGTLVVTLEQSILSGFNPVQLLSVLKSNISPQGPWNLVGSTQLLDWVRWYQITDLTPSYGSVTWYVAQSTDTQHLVSALSQPVAYVARSTP